MKKIKRTISTVLALLMIICMFPITSSAAYDYLFPVNNGGKIAYAYGYSESYGSWHGGIDIHSTGDDYIYAAYDGVVGATANSCTHVSCGYQCAHYNTYGNYIRINQDDGTKAYYGHLLKDSLLVSVGTRVTKGQAIAKMGSSGYSTGKHLHFEVRSGDTKINVNPTSSGGSINYSYSGYGGGSSPVVPSPSIAYTSIPEGEYKLQNAAGKYLGVESGGNQNANVHAVNGDSSAEQKFRIKNTEISNQYYIKSLANATQYCVNAYTPSDTLMSQSDARLWDENKSKSKYWGFEDAGNGYYYIRCMMNPQFVLTADGYSYPENVTVLPFDGRDTQKWKLEKIEEIPIQKEYIITYKWEGGRGGPSTQTKPQGVDIQIFDDYFPNRFGYSFEGWSTSPDAEKAQYIPGSTFSKDADTTLYAVWGAATELSAKLGRRTGELEFSYAGKCKYYKVNLEKDGLYRFEGSGSPNVQIYIMSPEGAVYAKDDNTESGNSFMLDYKLNAGTTYYIKLVCKEAGKINYSFSKLYTVSYDAKGGTGAPETEYKLYEVDMKITTDFPTREGYTFLGWSVSSDDDEVDAKPGATYKGDRDLRLYAVWEKNAHTHNWEWKTEEPTCTQDGKKYQLCECGETQNVTYLPHSHNFGEWVVVDRETEYPFTITQQRTCSLCGETETSNIVATPSIPDEVLYGDVNDDGVIDGLDATRLLQYLAEWDVVINFDSADVNKDGIVDGLDITRLLQYLAEWDVVLG